MEDMSRRCRGGGSASEGVAGGACHSIGRALVAGRVMEPTGVPLNCREDRAGASMLRRCQGGVGEVATRAKVRGGSGNSTQLALELSC